ncbi:MAG: hypothetical protein ACI8YQ_000275, partial [Polaribacter sp.]
MYRKLIENLERITEKIRVPLILRSLQKTLRK